MGWNEARCVELYLPGLWATVVPPKGEFLGDWVRELLHSGRWRGNGWRDTVHPVYLIITPAWRDIVCMC